MNYFEFVVVVLVYRNTSDLLDFFENFRLQNSKVIVVNSFHDTESEDSFANIAMNYNADFISVQNKGYGVGNNRGIEFAMIHYKFEYIIISNADITIRNFNFETLNPKVVTAPKIITKSGRNQSPSSPFAPGRWFADIKRWCFEGNHNRLLYVAYAYNRLTKILFYTLSPFRKKVFSAHGAFFIMPQWVVEKVAPLYNEKMFLFNEEEHLGKKLQLYGIRTEYNPHIIVDHKEDGSVSLLNTKLFALERASYLEYYRFWYIDKDYMKQW